MMDHIETERLFLRPLQLGDLDDLFALYGDRQVMKYITGQPRDYEATYTRLKAHIADHQSYGFGLCAAILKKTGEMIGRCGLEPVESSNILQGDLAWMFKQHYWGQGLATEFGRAMIAYGFAHLPVQRIFATADHANLTSIKVMKKLGMNFVKSDQRGVEYDLWRPGP
jgi:RimJ/RimL family protein N-acetyltransferase